MKEIKTNELKAILTDMLVEIDLFCREQNIQYGLFAGTLLGAIRHKGFIPWDDDIDIFLLRNDYKKLIKNFKSKSGHVKICSLENDKDYYYPYAKAIDTRTVLIEKIDHVKPIGAYIDIFPLDNCGNTHKKACHIVNKFYFWKWIWNFGSIQYSTERTMWKNVILFLGKNTISRFFSRRKLASIISSMGNKCQKLSNAYVGELMDNPYGYKEVYKKELVNELIDVEFEGHILRAPKRYDEMLTILYGDYMTPPPEDKRVSHHGFKVWWKDDK